MGNVMDYLRKQLKSEDAKLRKDAEDCIKIYETLKEMHYGCVWNTQWDLLVKVNYKDVLSNERTYRPTAIGYVFLKGIEVPNN